MKLLDELFRSAPLQHIFSDTEYLQSLLHFEAALARAVSHVGLIPEPAARAIATQCKAEYFDQQAIAVGAAVSGNVTIPVVKQLTALVAKGDKDAARYVHWGATSQDAMDTAVVLQLRRAFELLSQDLNEMIETLAELAHTHRHTPIVARTWMQQALPTSFGFIVAGWLDAIIRHRHRLDEIRPRVLSLQFGGAVGTLAAVADRGPAIAQTLAEDLHLPFPPAPWHTHRDRLAEVATTLGLLSGTLTKIARDISLHSQTEIGELSEGTAREHGGSSTMPQKHNPVTCAVVLAAGQRVPGLVSTLLNCMAQEQQRGLGGWQAEWETIPEIVCLTGGALHQLAAMFPHLKIHTDRMKSNLQSSSGLIFAEAVSFALAQYIGKAPAHQLLEVACQRAVLEKRNLKEILKEDITLNSYLNLAELDALFDATKYLGSSDFFIERVLNEARPTTAARQAS